MVWAGIGLHGRNRHRSSGGEAGREKTCIDSVGAPRSVEAGHAVLSELGHMSEEAAVSWLAVGPGRP